MTAGKYRVDIWDTEHGKILETADVTVASGTLDMALPELATELAIKIRVSH